MSQHELIKFTVPGVPVGKGRPRFTTHGGFARAITPQKTVNYENLIKLCFANNYPSFKPVCEPLEMHMIAYFDIPKAFNKKKREQALNGELRPTKKPDTDNIAKMKDALNGIAYDDDKQIVKETIEKLYSDEPRLEIIIRVWSKE